MRRESDHGIPAEGSAACGGADLLLVEAGSTGLYAICSKCNLMLPVSEFYVDRSKPAGHTADCRACRKQAVNEYASRNRAKEQDRKRLAHKRDSAAMAVRVAAWMDSHPEAVKAYRIYRRARRCGFLTIPAQCSACGQTAKLDGHHEDYTKPLKVEWLCRSCHKTLHANQV